MFVWLVTQSSSLTWERRLCDKSEKATKLGSFVGGGVGGYRVTAIRF